MLLNLAGPGNFPLGLAKDGAMMQEMRAPNRCSSGPLFKGPDEHWFGARISCIMAPSLANPRGKLPAGPLNLACLRTDMDAARRLQDFAHDETLKVLFFLLACLPKFTSETTSGKQREREVGGPHSALPC